MQKNNAIEKIIPKIILKNLVVISFLMLMATCGFSQKIWGQNTGNDANKVVKFYPNPATDYITLDINHVVEKGYSVQIYNCLGRMVKSVPIYSTHFTISITDLFRGLYVVQLRDKDGKIVESNKFQVNK